MKYQHCPVQPLDNALRGPNEEIIRQKPEFKQVTAYSRVAFTHKSYSVSHAYKVRQNYIYDSTA